MDIPPIKTLVKKNCHMEAHLHPEWELIYVIRGELVISLGDHSFTLTGGGILLLDAGSRHEIRSSGRTVSCHMMILDRVITSLLQGEPTHFHCNTLLHPNKPYERLRQILQQILLRIFDSSRRTDSMQFADEFRLLDLLFEHFLVPSTGQGTAKYTEDPDERLRRIVRYVHTHYRDPVSLSELSAQLFLSPSSVSRFFRKKTGVYFTDYVNQVRMQSAVSELRQTALPITKIAVDNGFSTPSAFSKAFQEQYRMTPSDYRKSNQPDSEPIEDIDAVKSLLQTHLTQWKALEPRDTPVQEKRVDLSAPPTDCPHRVDAVNIGSAQNLLFGNLQQQTALLCEQLPLSYVRIWNIFSDKLQIRAGGAGFNFDNLDIIFDFLVGKKIKPYLDFGIRPECVVQSETDVVYFDPQQIRFAARQEFEDLLFAFMRHIVKRYGAAETAQWLYELTFDSHHASILFDDGPYPFPLLYRTFASTVKKLLPGAKTGGASLPLPRDREHFLSFLQGCKELDCIPDFVSIMLFPYRHVMENGEMIRRRLTDPQHMLRQIDNAASILESLGLSGCSLYLSEWNNTLSNRNHINESCYRAAYIAKTISETGGRVDLNCLWIGSDWISNYSDSSKFISGSAGLLTKDGIRKPAYHACQFLGRLGSSLLYKDAHCIITEGGSQDFHVLCFNYKEPGYAYYLKNEDAFPISELREVFTDQSSIRLRFRFCAAAEGRSYLLKKRVVHGGFGSILDEWEKLGFEEELSERDLSYLHDICIPHLFLEKQTVRQGELVFEAELQPHEIALIHIYPSF